MADQTQRLEIATVRAEVGSNILYRFSNDAAAAAAIPTESGDIKNLKQVILEIQSDAADKISISTTIYPTVSDGLAATADQGIFLVQSDAENEIYSVWKNDSGSAVSTGKTALSATAIEEALQASNESAQAAEEAADTATARTAGFLSPSDTDPVVRENGLPLQVGDRYFNTIFQAEYIFTEDSWQANDSQQEISDLAEENDTQKGASRIGWDGSKLSALLNSSKTMETYEDLEAYGGPATRVQITSPGISGWFNRVPSIPVIAPRGVFLHDASGRKWKRDFSSRVDPKWCGAVGDGVTDDSLAIREANSLGVGLSFSPGTYAASGLVMSTSWFMCEDSLILFNGENNTPCVTCSGSNLKGSLNLSANNKSPSQLLNILGSDNEFETINMRDMASPVDVGVHVCLRIGGSRNFIGSVYGRNLLNTGNANDSSPQMMTLGGSSDGNYIGKVVGRSVRLGVLNYTTGSNSVGTIDVTGSSDNGLYCSMPGRISVDFLKYSGTDEPAVFIDGANAYVGSIMVEEAGNATVNFSDCGIVEIGTIFMRNGSRTILKSRNENVSSDSIRIGSVLGTFTGSGLVFMNSGYIRHVSIGRIDVTYVHDSAISGSLGSWARFNIAGSVTIGEADITIVDKDNVLTSSSAFIATFPVSPERPSTVGRFSVRILNSDKITPSLSLFQGKNLINQMVTLGAGFIQADNGPNLREVKSEVSTSGGIYVNNMPTVGSWKRGQVIWRAYPTAGGSPGWVCTTGGSPGTWKAMPAISA